MFAASTVPQGEKKTVDCSPESLSSRIWPLEPIISKMSQSENQAIFLNALVVSDSDSLNITVVETTEQSKIVDYLTTSP